MPDLLIELFSEEIPARMQARAAADLKRLVTDGLVEAGLTYASAGSFVTPRRLTLALNDHGVLYSAETNVGINRDFADVRTTMSGMGYAVMGFRADASEVIRAQTNHANVSRVRLLLLVFVTTGMALVMVWCLARSAVALRRLTAPFVAALVMLIDPGVAGEA